MFFINKNLTLIQLNDTHSYLKSHQELFWEGDHAQYKIVGYTETALNRNTALESTMDNFLLDSMLDLTGGRGGIF